jgi:hypothetical protein
MEKKNLATLVVFSLIFALASSSFLMTNVLAKNLNTPEGVIVNYVNAGGEALVNLPTTPLPTNYPAGTTGLLLRFAHCEIPNAKLSYDNLVVFLYNKANDFPGSTKNPLIPYLVVTDGADNTLQQTFWYGTPIYTNGSTYGLPSICNTHNIKVVDPDVLTIQRHGNDVTLSLGADQSIKVMMTGYPASRPEKFFTLPAFTLVLQNYGDAYEYTSTNTLGSPISYPGASMYTFVHDGLRFDATGTFSAAETSFLNGAQTVGANVIMHDTQTISPP